jgi:hypothetical protein
MLREWWESLVGHEAAMAISIAMKPMWDFWYWPVNPWIRRQLIRLSEVGWRFVPKRVRDDLETWASLMFTSLPCELGGGQMQKRVAAHQGKKASNVSKWKKLITSDVITDFDMKKPEFSAEAQIYCGSKLPKDLFDCSTWSFSMGEEFKELNHDATWMNITAEHRRECFASWRNFVESGFNWRSVHDAWLSVFAVPGMILHSDDPRMEGGIECIKKAKTFQHKDFYNDSFVFLYLYFTFDYFYNYKDQVLAKLF